jgi:hypothetical protein
MAKFKIELTCLASEIIEVKAKSLKSARRKAMKKHTFNADTDCVKVLIKEEHEIINSETFKTSFITLGVD